MAQCAFRMPNGAQCGHTVKPPQRYCYLHDPKNANERQRNASRAAKSKASKELRTLKAEVKGLIQRVRNNEVKDLEGARVMLQGYRVLKDYLELERRQTEVDEIKREIEELKSEFRPR